MPDKQLTHSETNFNTKERVCSEINLLLERLDSPANLGSIFRNAEAFGVKNIWVHESNRDYLRSNRFKRTSRSTENNLNICFYEDKISLLDTFEGTTIGIEITENSENMTSYKGNVSSIVLLVLGNEKSGLDSETLNRLDKNYHIKMLGTNSSLNVAQTLGIALYEIRREKI
ncbi:rRNA methyltransferase SpoU-like protein [Psychroflexus gondwanensis ACAM 44]|uniref:rRNA methyltransferase SpoU-like protein n=1 Tax=Psychroflexus gondwanensis ACAM 44 TaxID=1189619 RepID=N1WZS4_9FLAO|nr:TrmH family RNA methyltransferase [Psychroflexus gondwanensis]EMY81383.1 rRNA methyltransferase SpoU-like protein [Psychroflexus gondwanensis ACAM 44]